jgi:hypothetical protein
VAKCPACSAEVPDGPTVCPWCKWELAAGGSAPPAKPRISGLAIASLYLSIASLLMPPAFVLYAAYYPKLFGVGVDPKLMSGLAVSLTFLTSTFAIALGHTARKRISGSRGTLLGKDRALAALLVGYPIALMMGLLVAFGLTAHFTPSNPKMATNQASAVGSLHGLKAAADTFSATFGRGFPVDLAVLGPPEAKEPVGPEGSNLVDAWLARGQKSDYVFNYWVTAWDGKHFPSAYAVTAQPAEGCGVGYGNCYFMDDTGIIRFETERPASKDSAPVAR